MNTTNLLTRASQPRTLFPRVIWLAARDGQAHAAINRCLRTPCDRRPIDPRFAWPETQPRCTTCLAGVEKVLPAKQR